MTFISKLANWVRQDAIKIWTVGNESRSTKKTNTGFRGKDVIKAAKVMGWLTQTERKWIQSGKVNHVGETPN